MSVSLAPASVALALALAWPVAAQSFPLASADLADSTALSRTMPRLATQVMAVYAKDGRSAPLDDLFRLQIVADRYDDAAKSLAALRDSRARSAATPQGRALDVQYEIYLTAKQQQIADGRPFAQAFALAFRQMLGELDDRTAALVLRTFAFTARDMGPDLRAAIAAQEGKTTIDLAPALAVLRAYQALEAYREFAPLAQPLVDEDDRRRYIIERNIGVKASDGATICVEVTRPRNVPGRLPTLFAFTIYADSGAVFREERRTASNGYAAVTGFTRGKVCSPQQPLPYRHDGTDGATVIDWISQQRWSDGRVGMYGGSYLGFTQWAVAKHMPKALKAMMAGAANAPAVDTPMEGNVFWNFIYPWPLYTTDNKTLDNATYFDNARWSRLNHDWYVSGRPYRELDKIDGHPNPIFDQWIAHPAYDAYWQSLIPYEQDFARITIPVLQTAGYYYGGPGAAVYYFTEHYKYNPRAEHYLVIGPYDHIQGQRGVVGAFADTATILAGYEIDPVARLDIVADLRYQWFDYVLKGGPRPALLQDKVNYEVTGANVWKHAPSLAAMANGTRRFHLSASRVGNAYRLSPQAPTTEDSIAQTVDFTDRSDADAITPGGGVADTAVDTSNAVEFVSDPLTEATEASGLFSGQLSFVTNKKDFDFSVSLYELTGGGKYIQLAPYWGRASYARDRSHRRLLSPNTRERITFKSVRLMSRQLQAGSRLIVVLGIIKEPGRQINYGTGRDVSDESIADGKEALHITWYGDSYIDVPVRK